MAYQPKSYRKFLAGTVTAAVVASAIAPAASAAPAAKTFPDLEKIKNSEPEAYKAVNYLVDLGVIQGYKDGTFKPNQTLTRGNAAEMLVKALGLTPKKDGLGKVFKDQKANSYHTPYSEAIAEAGIISGFTDGTFGPSKGLTREQMAKILVNAYGLKDTGEAVTIKDLNRASAGQAENIKILAQHKITNLPGGNFNPKAQVKRSQFALFLYRVMEGGVTSPDVTGVKAINNTTVEVKFKEAISDINSYKFTIDGLEVKNAVVKQTDSKTVVLTTAAQEGGKSYTVKSGSKSLGTFKGISAVIPTAIKVLEPSIQGTIGKEVTVKAEVTVANGQSKAGIPVTFNIINDNSNLNNKIEVEAVTDEKGIATYSYTRYYKHNDNVTAYATEKSSVFSTGKVYWAEGLTLTEVTEGNALANGAKKVYKVKTDSYQVALDANGKEAYKYVNVAFAENVNVSPDKLVRGVKVIDTGISTNQEYPSQVTTGGVNEVRVKVNNAGEATFTLTGSDAEVTPVVFVDSNKDGKWSATDLQAAAQKVKFALSHTLGLDVKALGTANAAAMNAGGIGEGGREYTVTVKDKNGKIAPAGTKAYVTFADGSYSTDKQVFIADANGKNQAAASKNTRYEITVKGKEGKASFRLMGARDAFAAPTVYMETGSEQGLDKNDLQVVGETTYFVNAVVANANLDILDVNGNPVTSVINGETAIFGYQSVDQNGFDYYTGNGTYEVTFEVNANFGDVTVKDANNNTIGLVNKGTTKSFKVNANKGYAEIKTVSNVASTVTVQASASQVSLPNKSATLEVKATPETKIFAGDVIALDTKNKNIYLNDSTKTEMFNYNGADFFDNTSAGINTPIPEADFLKAMKSGSKVTYKKVGDTKQFYVTAIGSGGDLSPAPPSTDKEIPGTVIQAFTKATSEELAEFFSSKIKDANFTNFGLKITDGISTSDVIIKATDSADTIAKNINNALATAKDSNAEVKPIKATATVTSDGRVKVTAEKNVNLKTTSDNTSVFPSVDEVYKAATPAKGSEVSFDFTSATNITEGQKVIIDGVAYTAGTSTVGTTFDASGDLASDVAALASVITVTNGKISATASTSTLTVKERAGKEGTASLGKAIITLK